MELEVWWWLRLQGQHLVASINKRSQSRACQGQLDEIRLVKTGMAANTALLNAQELIG
jgi:hypothetical protein